MRILHIASAASAFPLFRLQFLQQQVKLGHTVHLACRNQPYYVDALRAAGFVVHVIELPRRLHPTRSLRGFIQLRRIIRQGQYGVVHVHQPMAALIGVPAALSAHQRCIFYTTGGLRTSNDAPVFTRPVIAAVERKLCSACTAVFSVSREDLKIAAQYKLLDLSRIHYVGPRGGCGIDTRRFFPLLDAARKQRLRHELGLPETGKSFLVAIVARTVWEKGFREVIDVAASYPRSEVTFVVAGDGRDLGAIKASAVRRRAARSMLFLGATERVPELLRAVDAFALPSYREGVPVSLLEAMASGLPVIATNIRGAREVLEPGKTGILVDRGSAAELLRAVQTLASDAELRRQLGAAARKSVEKHYAEDVILPAYVRLWGKLIAECA